MIQLADHAARDFRRFPRREPSDHLGIHCPGGDRIGAGPVSIPSREREILAGLLDFAYYRLEVSGVYFIGGFGVMGWISAENYTKAKPDPLAEAATGIIQHMNADHADALKQIAGLYAGETVDEAAITAVDRLGFHLRLKSGKRVYGRRIAFIRGVTSTEDARSVFVDMVRQARTV